MPTRPSRPCRHSTGRTGPPTGQRPAAACRPRRPSAPSWHRRRAPPWRVGGSPRGPGAFSPTCAWRSHDGSRHAKRECPRRRRGRGAAGGGDRTEDRRRPRHLGRDRDRCRRSRGRQYLGGCEDRRDMHGRPRRRAAHRFDGDAAVAVDRPGPFGPSGRRVSRQPVRRLAAGSRRGQRGVLRPRFRTGAGARPQGSAIRGARLSRQRRHRDPRSRSAAAAAGGSRRAGRARLRHRAGPAQYHLRGDAEAWRAACRWWHGCSRSPCTRRTS